MVYNFKNLFTLSTQILANKNGLYTRFAMCIWAWVGEL